MTDLLPLLQGNTEDPSEYPVYDPVRLLDLSWLMMSALEPILEPILFMS